MPHELGERLFWQVQELNAPLTLCLFGAYPLSYITKTLKAARDRVNSAQWSTALMALENYYLNTDPKTRSNRTIADYLPYPLDQSKTTTFDVLTAKEKRVLQKHLDNMNFGARLWALIYALGWSDL